MKTRVLIVLTLVLIAATGALVVWNLYSSTRGDTTVISSSRASVTSSPVVVEVPNFEKYDRIYLILNSNTPVTAVDVEPTQSLISLPFDVEGVKNDLTYRGITAQRFFYIANKTGNARVMLGVQPKIPYAVKILEGKVNFQISSYSDLEATYLDVKMNAQEFAETGFAQLALFYPIEEVSEPDFQITGRIRLLGGRIAYANIILITQTDWYAFGVATAANPPGSSVDFRVDASSRELFGKAVPLGERVLFIGLGVGLSDKDLSAGAMPQANIAVGDMTIVNGGKSIVVEARALNEYDLDYTLYVFRKFRPSYIYLILLTALLSQVAAATFLAVRLWRRERLVED